jgi:hypothetical protein
MRISRYFDQNPHNTTPQGIAIKALRLPRADGNPARDPYPLRRLASSVLQRASAAPPTRPSLPAPSTSILAVAPLQR